MNLTLWYALRLIIVFKNIANVRTNYLNQNYGTDIFLIYYSIMPIMVYFFPTNLKSYRQKV